DLKKVLSFPPYPGDYLHPVVYACTAVMLLCLLVSIVTYIVHHVGIVLHYASLSTMLWLTFTARNICKDVSKDPLQRQDRNRPSQTRTKPVILFYLVSDGIPIIIVGVTAAFGMDNYGSRDDALCWMAWEPSLGGFYAPMSLLVLVMSVYFLWTYIQLKRHPERKYELQVLREEQQQLSSNESSHHYHTDTGAASVPAGDCQAFVAGMSVLANEHSFKSQLRATVFTLFLFLATWALGALAVSLGHFLDMIFSCLYGAFCVTLGLFLLIQHCAKRDDVWHRWWACCSAKSKTVDGPGEGQNHGQELHQPHFHSLLSGKQELLSTHLIQSSHHKIPPPPQSPMSNHIGPCCVAVMSPVSPSPILPLAEPMPSPCSQSLPDELPHPTLALQSCLADKTKSRSFNRPRPCFQDYRSHMTSTSMDGSVHSTHLDSPHTVHHIEASPLVSNSPYPDLQLPCLSHHLDKQLVSCHNLQHKISCHSVQDSIASCNSHTHNMRGSISSCHSLLMPSHGVDTCLWHMYCSADHSSSTNCCERASPFTLHYEQDLDTLSCMADKEKDNVCLGVEQKDFPRNTLPRQHGTVNRRGPIGRNRSLQEDSLVGSDATGNIRTGPWKNETTV
uniref:Adhesion G protein-coupled receptor A1a n=1 Tax=Amphilophus citrinellus TaxID=61819 RepID=A0A3Q0RTK8_AMPCI